MEILEKICAVLTDGTEVKVFQIKNGKFSFCAMNYGATLTSLCTPDKNGNSENIVLSLSTFNEYINNPKYFGAIVGRVANRIKNAHFSLCGKDFNLDKNENENCLHGGFESYSDKIFDAKTFSNENESGVIFSYLSADMEQGFPGNLQIQVKYALSNKNEFSIEISGKTDKKTPVNIINHSYFNLAGKSHKSIYSTKMKLNCEKILELDSENLPTGKILDIKNTEFDFTNGNSFENALEKHKKCFDECFLINGEGFRKFAEFSDSVSGRKMDVFSNQNAVQIYTPFYEKQEPFIGKNGKTHSGYAAFCFETQNLTDAVNHENFPSVILEPGNEYFSKTMFVFYS